MRGSKTILLILALLVFILLGLGGLFLWLTGAFDGKSEATGEEAVRGLLHVRTIYTADGENLYRPVGVGVDEDGGFFVTLRDAQRVVEFDRDGDWRRSWGERGLEQGQLMAPVGVAVDRLADHVYVTDRSRLRLICYSTDGRFLWEIPVLNPIAPFIYDGGVAVATFGPIALFTDQGEVVGQVGTRGMDEGQFDYPRAAVSVGTSQAIVADSNNNRIQRVSLSGEVTTPVSWVDGTPAKFQDDPEVSYVVPSGVAVDDRGRAFVLDGFKHTIAVLDADTGKTLHKFTELQGRGDGHFNLPTGIAHLHDDYFAITDTYNDRVQIVRLLLPGEDNVVNRNPWLLWLPLFLLLPLLPLLFGRKRWYATEEALGEAQAEENLRLLAAVARRLFVLPEVRDRFADVVEGEVAVGSYLTAVDAPEGGDPEDRLADTARPAGRDRLLLPRVRVIAGSDEQAMRLREAGIKAITYRELKETYTIADTKVAPESA